MSVFVCNRLSEVRPNYLYFWCEFSRRKKSEARKNIREFVDCNLQTNEMGGTSKKVAFKKDLRNIKRNMKETEGTSQETLGLVQKSMF